MFQANKLEAARSTCFVSQNDDCNNEQTNKDQTFSMLLVRLYIFRARTSETLAKAAFEQTLTKTLRDSPCYSWQMFHHVIIAMRFSKQTKLCHVSDVTIYDVRACQAVSDEPPA